MRNGWTGGQWSLVRFALGLYLAQLFLRLAPVAWELFSEEGALPDAAASPLARLFPNPLAFYDPPWFAAALAGAAAAASLAFALGWRERAAALVAWFLLASFVGRQPFLADSALPLLGWLLLFHALCPRAPYLSLAARGRTDPAGGWSMPAPLHFAAWVLLLASVLLQPARAWFLPAALLAPFPQTRFVAWALLGGAWFLEPHLLLLSLAAFDPAWLRPAPRNDLLFYDGDCGLCHRAVRFALAEGPGSLRFAPLGGETFLREVGRREGLPDSVVVKTAEGGILVRSRAAIRILRCCGGLWALVAAALWIVPLPLRDALYDGVASIRRRIFPKPEGVCPLLPAEARSRFLS